MAALLFAGFAMAGGLEKDQIPEPVMSNFNDEFKEVSNIHWSKDGEIYEVEFSLNGQGIEVSYDAEGQWIETEREIEPGQVPEVVIGSIKKRYQGQRPLAVKSIKNNRGQHLYEVQLSSDSGTIEVTVDQNGEPQEPTE